ncbi:MAG: hypothetical protein JWQ27_2736 [Ferruginibacter sp.]|nr:hypothetical protein [Ferruginibacter sp.]
MNNNSIFHKLRIAVIRDETPLTKTFVLEPLDGWEAVYQPGQFITLVFETGYGEKRRSYSISSANDEALSITVKKVDNGEFSRQLIYRAKVGEVLLSSGIGGFFVLPEKPDEFDQYFFLAAGSGITPCFALIKTLLKQTNKNITLIYSNRDETEAIFYDELKTLQQKHSSRFNTRFLFSELRDVHQSRLSKWLLEQLLNEYLKVEKNQAVFYLCGPLDYMLMAEISLRGYGISAQQMIRENFSSLPRKQVLRPTDTSQHLVTVSINDNKFQYIVQYPETILSAAKKLGIQLPYSCEAGRCGSCAATCTKGKVWMAYNEVLMDDELAKGRILTCQGFPVDGDINIEY